MSTVHEDIINNPNHNERFDAIKDTIVHADHKDIIGMVEITNGYGTTEQATRIMNKILGEHWYISVLTQDSKDRSWICVLSNEVDHWLGVVAKAKSIPIAIIASTIDAHVTVTENRRTN